LRALATRDQEEKTGARGLVSAVENALILFEKALPSANVHQLPVDEAVVTAPGTSLEKILAADEAVLADRFAELKENEQQTIEHYLEQHRDRLAGRYRLMLTPERIRIAAAYYCRNIVDTDTVLKKISHYYDEVKNLEVSFYKDYSLNIVLENDAIDHILDRFVNEGIEPETYYRQLSSDFEHGLRLIYEKTGNERFFITAQALAAPEVFVADILKSRMNPTSPAVDQTSDTEDPASLS